MKLNSVKLNNWKGQSALYELGKLNLVVGANGSGKTAILEAIHFACEGRTSLGDSPQAAINFCGPSGGGVHVGIDEGFGWQRQLVVDHAEGKVSQELAIDGRGIGKVKETEGAIKERIGRDGEIFSPMFRLGTFLDLSDDKRRDFVLQLCARAHRGVLSDPSILLQRIITAYLTESLGPGTVSTNQDRPDANAFLYEKLAEGERKAIASMISEITAKVTMRGDIAECLNSTLTIAKDGIAAARRAKDEANSAVRQISERLQEIRVSAESAEALRAKLAKVREDRGELEKQIARQEAVQQARAGLARRIDLTRADISSLDAAIKAATPEQMYGDLAALEAQAEEAGKCIHANPENELKALEQDENQARIELGEASKTWSDLMTAVGRAKNEAERAQKLLAVAEADDWTKLWKLLDDYETEYAFPADAERHWRQIVEFVAERKTADLDVLRANLQSTTEAFNLTNNQYEAASAIHDAAKTALHNATTALREARSKASDESRESIKRAGEAAKLREQARSIRSAIERAAQADANRAERLTKLQSDIVQAEADLNRFDAELGGFVPVDSLQIQRAALTATILNIEDEIKAKDGNDRLKDEYNKCVLDAEAQAVKWEVCKRLAEAVKKLREEIMAELVAPLLAGMDDFFLAGRTTLKAHCGLVDAKGGRVFDLGIQRGDARIVYAALSGGERCLVGAALAYALVMLADPPLKLLMLEAAEADDFMLHTIQMACESLAPNLSNVILATWVEVLDAHNWNTIVMGKEAVAA